jgi:hypothetical protein
MFAHRFIVLPQLKDSLLLVLYHGDVVLVLPIANLQSYVQDVENSVMTLQLTFLCLLESFLARIYQKEI